MRSERSIRALKGELEKLEIGARAETIQMTAFVIRLEY